MLRDLRAWCAETLKNNNNREYDYEINHDV